MLRKKEEKRLASIEDSVDAAIKGLEECAEKINERQIVVASNIRGNIRSNRNTI